MPQILLNVNSSALRVLLTIAGLAVSCALLPGGVLYAVNNPVVSTFAGSGVKSFKNGDPKEAAFNNPRGVAVDSKSNVYVADSGNHRIRKISPFGNVSVLAGGGSGTSAGFKNAVGTNAVFYSPSGVAVDAYDNVIVADTGNHRIRLIKPDGTVLPIAGNGAGTCLPGATGCDSGSFKDGQNTSASFSSPYGVAVSKNGSIFVADCGNDRVRKITLGLVSTIHAFSAVGSTSAQFNCPRNVATDLNDNVIFTDGTNNRIKKITPQREVITIAGNTVTSCVDGMGVGASFIDPKGIAIDSRGDLYVSDAGASCQRIRKVTASGIVTTLVGNGATRFFDGGPSDASFSSPFGVAVDSNGTLYVADELNHRIRKVTFSTCPGGYFCPTFSSTQFCPPGSACPAGSFSPVPCPPGTFSQSGLSSCLPCPRATFTANIGSAMCEGLCPPGTYGTSIGGTTADLACRPCAAGFFTNYAGGTACDPCPPGRYGLSSGANSESWCLACPPGTLNPFSGASSQQDCSSCPPGSFADAPGSSRCTPCAAGKALDSAGGTTASDCKPCRAGTYNPAPGQTSSACVSCPAGKFSDAGGASTLGACANCLAGTFSPPGADGCTRAPPGKYAPGEGSPIAVDCPLGRYFGSSGGAIEDACKPCPQGTTTASTGAFFASQCLSGAFECPPGFQPASAVAAPQGAGDCARLSCAAPLRPEAFLAFQNDSAALKASSACVGCGPGRVGTPGTMGCTPCAPGEFCPGLLSRPLYNFSSSAEPSVGDRAHAARPDPWGACPKLSAPLSPAPGFGASEGAPLSRAQQAFAAGGAALVLLLLLGCAAARSPPPHQPRTWVARAGWLAVALDMYSLSHITEQKKSPVKRSTVAGGVFTLLGLTGIATYAAYMVLQWQDANTLVQRSLDAVDGGVWRGARGLPWAAAPLPGAPGATGLLLRLTLDGEPGKCSEPLLDPTASGLLRGAWAKAGAVPDCGGSGVSQLTYACADCDLGSAAALSFSFHYSCQSLLLEAAAVPAYPASATSVIVAEASATAAGPRGGALLTTLTWEAPILFTQCWDSVTTGGLASKRGYAFTLSSVAHQRQPLTVDASGNLLVRPTAATLNLTIALPLSPTFVTTSLTPLVPWTQLLANIVGLSGVLSVVGVLFGAVEKPSAVLPACLRGGCRKPLAAVDGFPDDPHAQLKRLRAFVKKATKSSANAVAFERRMASALQGAAATENPIRAGRALAWQRHSDGKDTWYSNAAGKLAWELPEGAMLAVEWRRCTDGVDVWFANSAGDTAWTLPEGSVLALS